MILKYKILSWFSDMNFWNFVYYIAVHNKIIILASVTFNLLLYFAGLNNNFTTF